MFRSSTVFLFLGASNNTNQHRIMNTDNF
jgi:hypothetical protein